jgi:hypothetical protein
VRKPRPKWRVGHEADAEFSRGLQRLLRLLTIEQRILCLNSGDWMNAVGTADGFRSSLGQSEVADLALPHQIGHGPDRLLDWHLRVDAVLVVQVDDVNLEPLQTGFTGLTHIVGSAIHALARFGPYLSEFGGKNHLIPTAGNGLSDQLLVLAPAVHVGCIEESHALVERIADERDGLLIVALAIDAGEGHAAEAEG